MRVKLKDGTEIDCTPAEYRELQKIQNAGPVVTEVSTPAVSTDKPKIHRKKFTPTEKQLITQIYSSKGIVVTDEMLSKVFPTRAPYVVKAKAKKMGFDSYNGETTQKTLSNHPEQSFDMKAKVLDYIRTNPMATIREIAKHFDIYQSVICEAVKPYGGLKQIRFSMGLKARQIGHRVITEERKAAMTYIGKRSHELIATEGLTRSAACKKAADEWRASGRKFN